MGSFLYNGQALVRNSNLIFIKVHLKFKFLIHFQFHFIQFSLFLNYLSDVTKLWRLILSLSKIAQLSLSSFLNILETDNYNNFFPTDLK